MVVIIVVAIVAIIVIVIGVSVSSSSFSIAHFLSGNIAIFVVASSSCDGLLFRFSGSVFTPRFLRSSHFAAIDAFATVVLYRRGSSGLTTLLRLTLATGTGDRRWSGLAAAATAAAPAAAR